MIVPGNIYNYGENAPDVLSETTDWQPTTRKGRLRVKMEETYRASGVQTIILRSGDYFERDYSGSWFEAHIAVNAHKGRTMYPGPLCLPHAWAYLPDKARVAVMLADKRETLEQFNQFGFEGYTLTGQQLTDQISQATGKPQKVSGLPWFALRILGLFRPNMREVYEMRYLWNVPHRMDGSKLARFLPDFTPTPIDLALKDALTR